MADYYTAVGDAAGIQNLAKISWLLLHGYDVLSADPGGRNTLVLRDDAGTPVHIDGCAAQRRAAIAAQLTVYCAFADPEKTMDFDIRFHEKTAAKKKAAS